jgi:hypothetical protein
LDKLYWTIMGEQEGGDLSQSIDFSPARWNEDIVDSFNSACGRGV